MTTPADLTPSGWKLYNTTNSKQQQLQQLQQLQQQLSQNRYKLEMPEESQITLTKQLRTWPLRESCPRRVAGKFLPTPALMSSD